MAQGSVLIFEDEAENLRSLTKALEKVGYEVKGFQDPRDGHGALRHAGRHRPRPHGPPDARHGRHGGPQAREGERALRGGAPHHRLRLRGVGRAGHEGGRRRLPGQARGPLRAAAPRAGPRGEAPPEERGGRAQGQAGRALRLRAHHRQLRAHAGALPAGAHGGAHQGDGPHPGRVGHGQGAHRQRHPPELGPQAQPLPPHQLRRHPREPHRERALRPREGLLHGGRQGPPGQVRAGHRRDPLPGRDRRAQPGPPGQAPARPGGARGDAGGGHPAHPRGRAHRHGHPPRPARRWCPRASSARTSCTG